MRAFGIELAEEGVEAVLLLEAVLDASRRHLVTVREENGGRLGINLAPELGDVM